MLSKISQTEKDKNHDFTHMYKATNEQTKETHRNKQSGGCWRERRGGERMKKLKGSNIWL